MMDINGGNTGKSSSRTAQIQEEDIGKEERAYFLQFVMVEVWWSVLGAAIPAVISGQAFRMKKRHAEEQRNPIPDTCVTVCGVSEPDVCSDACARTVCVNQHQNDICLRRCQSECLRLSASNSH
ncbi:putative WRKY transcription factor 51-like [Hibiscus syriacus]|uniref:WRKY transcription factor 51-like n=1 Tax=Hibiscus syriacus TaxID=106335 RepID=A0A6A3A890_HIBSY|nr:putative WRKY transcription factor 51-like [Hibiscus syriacus]